MSSSTLIVTFIRHGESTDNLRSVWAGWQDAPLSNHGMNQARALGEYFKDTSFSAIHASDLKRAHSTAQALYDGQPDPKPPFIVSQLLREQHFGIAEGQPWTFVRDPKLSLKEHYAAGRFPVLDDEDEGFPDGESVLELAARARRALAEAVMPHVWHAAREGRKGVHVAVVSHGLCISQLVAELLKKSAVPFPEGDHRGLANTAWTRLTVDVKGSVKDKPLEFPDNDLPPLEVRVTDVDRHSHTDKIKRQKGGIGSAAYDPSQQDIRAFFGGKVEAQPVPESNARDAVVDDIPA
ncbi:phosphoglycerate mutase-like protein [Auriscalpium vulgare]|uniref:Phosphoglycerate mutase-like protein n=1 Tax=Auriscalpium vulgare TaxID=40419 RepID=A0ACB8RI67_9AGAM|nr:phosphoglycerate mutase-like protein [Auriscalpium vulgare]